MRNIFRQFMTDKLGSTSLEYAIIASLLSITIVGATTNIGSKLNSLYFGNIMAGFNN
ncbi:MAG TPA: Flp family type IVb pilin [Methylocystis sp.]|jgi:Flp pilus assembly pilin Flp